MDGGTLIIQIDWVFFLGIFGVLILIAYYTSGRFTKIETDITWLKDAVKKIEETVREVADSQRIAKDNKNFQLMGNSSPLRLKDAGIRVLSESGMKEYVDTYESELHKQCGHNCDISAYEIQENVFDLFDNLEFDTATDKKFKDYAYEQGMNMETIRRIGAIYFRDKCLNNYDIDTKFY